MINGRYIMVAGLIALVATQAWAEDFPNAPRNMKEAEAQGLAHVGIKQLKAFIPGSIRLKGVKGPEMTKIFHADGSLVMEAIQTKYGSWHFNKKLKGYCDSVNLDRKIVKACYKVFRAADGAHYFNYQAKTGFFAEVWRPLPKQ